MMPTSRRSLYLGVLGAVALFAAPLCLLQPADAVQGPRSARGKYQGTYVKEGSSRGGAVSFEITSQKVQDAQTFLVKGKGRFGNSGLVDLTGYYRPATGQLNVNLIKGSGLRITVYGMPMLLQDDGKTFVGDYNVANSSGAREVGAVTVKKR